MNTSKNKTIKAFAPSANRDLDHHTDAKAQSGTRYYCRKCGTVTYSESWCPSCRKCGASLPN